MLIASGALEFRRQQHMSTLYTFPGFTGLVVSLKRRNHRQLKPK
jgi:hypothetical protein